MIDDLHQLITCHEFESEDIVTQLATKYNCSKEKIYWTVRSVFGDRLRNLRWNFREPTRTEFLRIILMCSNKEELRQHYSKIPNSQWVGVYDRVLGVSTFSKAKEIALIEILPNVYIPQTDNNEAMWAACRLGDGSFDQKRNSWKIEHCAAQLGWLERKVEMFVKAFPTASSKIVYNEKRNTYSWYSCKIAFGKFREIGTKPKHEVVSKLNEFGLWYLFLDDGCYFNKSQQLVSYAVENLEIGTRLAELLRSKNHPFRITNKNQITMTGVENVLMFHKNILEPFNNLTPDCMKYKTTYTKI